MSGKNEAERMPVPQELLDVLACPVCIKPLTLSPQQDSLKCAACRRVYPIRDGFPILLIDQATIENS